MDPSLLSVQHVVGDAGLRLIVVGEVDLQTTPVLRVELDRAVEELTDEQLVVDLTGVRYIDSTGLNALLTAASRCAERGRSLTVVPSPQARRLFEIADSDHLLDHDGADLSQPTAPAPTDQFPFASPPTASDDAPVGSDSTERGERNGIITSLDR